MEFRQRTLFNGQTFDVPRYIVRLDTRNTHGWQVRYGKWKYFADGIGGGSADGSAGGSADGSADGGGAAAALLQATAELARRIAKLPAPTGLRQRAADGKANDLPVGISGPTARRREGDSFTQYYLQVNYPVAGAKPANRSVYVGTENTVTPEKYSQALAKAIALRDSGVRKFKLATTKAQRETVGVSGLAEAS